MIIRSIFLVYSCRLRHYIRSIVRQNTCKTCSFSRPNFYVKNYFTFRARLNNFSYVHFRAFNNFYLFAKATTIEIHSSQRNVATFQVVKFIKYQQVNVFRNNFLFLNFKNIVSRICAFPFDE